MGVGGDEKADRQKKNEISRPSEFELGHLWLPCNDEYLFFRARIYFTANGMVVAVPLNE